MALDCNKVEEAAQALFVVGDAAVVLGVEDLNIS